ncbi:MAG TPA: hypothetical protein VKD72_26315, partial [Gemmataceae bacterium]|nr:hypothetical protein [Gemmataceae bacterium]
AGKPISPPGGNRSEVHSIVFTPDGQGVLTSSFDGVLLWDVRTGKELRRIEVKEVDARRRHFNGMFRTYGIFPDGKRLLVADGGGGGGCVMDTATGEVEFNLSEQCFRWHRAQATLASADGTLLAVWPKNTRGTRSIPLWSLTSGKELHRLETKYEDLTGWALTPDGKTLAAASAPEVKPGVTGSTVQLWDTATGREVAELDPGEDRVYKIAISPDGTLLAAGVFTREFGTQVLLWHVATRREILRLPCDDILRSNLLFASDGRTLALAHYVNQQFCIRVWEMASGKVRCEFRTNNRATELAFAPDGRTLAAGADDTTVTLWDVGGQLATVSKGKPSTKELEESWSALDEMDAVIAHRAMVQMAASPREAVDFLKTRLIPAEATPVDEKTLSRLIADLDSEEFSKRDQANKELAKLGSAAKSALEKALRAQPPAEQRRRIEELLEKLNEPGPKREMLRPTRAIEILERLGSPEARGVLQALAEGQPDAWLTREAKAALQRLGRRAAP